MKDKIHGTPHALYYDGKLVGIILNPDEYPGGISDICDSLSPDEGLADAVSIPTRFVASDWGILHTALKRLGVKDEL